VYRKLYRKQDKCIIIDASRAPVKDDHGRAVPMTNPAGMQAPAACLTV
jgi:hypothetical protein